MKDWREATVERVTEWAPGLLTLRLAGPPPPFAPGQFMNLGLEVDGEQVHRSYSMASAPGEPLEFFLTAVEGGALSPRLCALTAGATVWVGPHVAGRFTLERVRDAEVLWLVATGTGLGPYISMLRTDDPWRRFERIIVVHGVRVADHLAYQGELEERSAAHGGRLTWVPVVSREDADRTLRGRVTAALEDGRLEEAAAQVLTPESSQVLLCGNPAMVDAMRALLDARGLRRNRPRAPGHVTTEKYWG